MTTGRHTPFAHRATPEPRARALALTDAQMQTVLTAAQGLPSEKRVQLLERVGARLRLQVGHPSDNDVSIALTHALRGLLQGSAA